MMNTFQQFFIGWRFPVVLISLLGFFSGMMGLVLLIPDTGGPAAAFAQDFKVWCFGYDPATGAFEWTYLWMFLVQPLVLIGFVGMVWITPLREVLASAPRRIGPYVGGTFVVVCSLVGGLVLVTEARPATADPAVFPAERIRTAHRPVPFTLINQDRELVTLDTLDGRVVLLTAVYASCSYTCPMILGQTKRALAALTPAERDALTVLAITLDPEHDTPDVLQALMAAQDVEAPSVHALTGEPAYVNDVLDRYGFARARNPGTGVIDHTNLFILIDRNGRIAYRFSLGEQQEAWLVEALRLLLREQRRS